MGKVGYLDSLGADSENAVMSIGHFAGTWES